MDSSGPGEPERCGFGKRRRAESTDGGSSWNFVSAGFGAFHGGMDFSADGSVLYLGEEGGVWKATNAAVIPWALTDLNATLATQEFLRIAIHPTDPTNAFAGAQSNGMDVYSGALTWQSVSCDDGGDAAFDFMNPSTIYATCTPYAGIIKVDRRRRHLFPCTERNRCQRVLTRISSRSGHGPGGSAAALRRRNHVWQSTDGADTGPPSLPFSVPALESGSPWPLPRAIRIPSTWGIRMGVYVSTNAKSGSGATWTNISAGLPLNLASATTMGRTCVYLSRVAVDFSNASTAYATFASYVSGHVYKTTNNGASWTDISGNLPNLKVNDIAIDPDVPNTLYIATEQGVYSTADGGNTWNLLGTGLPNVAVTALKLHRPTRILRAATYGRSVWDLQLLPVASPVALSSTSLSFSKQGPETVTLTNNGTAPLTLYSITAPNGFSQTNTCGVQIKAGGNCTITVSFAPPSRAPSPGDITLTDDAPGSPQVISVSGTGSHGSGLLPGHGFRVFWFRYSDRGTYGTYTLSVTPQGGFNQTVARVYGSAVPGNLFGVAEFSRWMGRIPPHGVSHDNRAVSCDAPPIEPALVSPSHGRL